MWRRVQVVNLRALVARSVRLVHQQCVVNAQELKERGIVKVSGKDAGPFLQGLMTNDIKHLDEKTKYSMYCMFLNTQGRILYDAIIYSPKESDSYLIECDTECLQPLVKHLSMFRVRRKITVAVEEKLRPWVLFDQPPEDLSKEVILSKDPRVKELGWRVLIDSDRSLSQLIQNLHVENADRYTELRYQLGIGEGYKDMPPGTCFPLEYNCDYLHGVSFHKGCYLGQELTARTYHTGVIRKRLMPVVFQQPLDPVNLETTVTDENGSRVGKLRGYLDGSIYGIGLLRIQQVLSASQLKIGTNLINTHRPTWWPIEAPKDRTQLDSSSL
ncbi:hypothetical protein GHT06_013689 [Daphnia sinensis]|uniref:CAF17 C-terminal domain-containing protein n=1 Tax=Daphnia sinensis TaxID=1820382 RepID=A0AAD5KSC0_9CRUS|nr:hypothetical protein GHT06_013689 [Daphnia sinensis]